MAALLDDADSLLLGRKRRKPSFIHRSLRRRLPPTFQPFSHPTASLKSRRRMHQQDVCNWANMYAAQLDSHSHIREVDGCSALF
jgi:hypothetical protein